MKHKAIRFWLGLTAGILLAVVGAYLKARSAKPAPWPSADTSGGIPSTASPAAAPATR